MGGLGALGRRRACPQPAARGARAAGCTACPQRLPAAPPTRLSSTHRRLVAHAQRAGGAVHQAAGRILGGARRLLGPVDGSAGHALHGIHRGAGCLLDAVQQALGGCGGQRGGSGRRRHLGQSTRRAAFDAPYRAATGSTDSRVGARVARSRCNGFPTGFQAQGSR